MSEKIEPALTAEEWAVADEVKTAIVDRLGAPHAVAAVCLHNQPFGFTREDVSMLRELALECHGQYTGSEADSDYEHSRDERCAKIDALADRIEALLPPEGEAA